MAKANPKAWFTSPIARISFKKVDKWGEYHSKFYPYFPTWEQARDWMLAKADERLKKAQAELKSATKHREKVAALVAPAGQEGEQPPKGGKA